MADLNGTTGNDTLTGTSGDDNIKALGGVDEISGAAGNDTITYGGTGATPTYGGGAGDDTFVISTLGGATTAHLHGDNNATGLNTFATATDGSTGAGTDTLKLSVQLLNDGAGGTDFETGAFDPLATEQLTVHNVAGGILTANLTGIEKIEFTNGTLDLTAGDDQFFAADLSIPGGSDLDMNAALAVAKVDLSAIGDAIITDDSGSFATITHINGKKVTADTAIKLDSGATVTVQTGSLDEIDYVRSNTFNYKADADKITVTLSDGTNSIDREVTITTAATKAPANTPVTGIIGSDDADTVNLLGGNDEIKAGKGNDSITGGFGDDTLQGDAGDDNLDGSGGTDVAVYTKGISGSGVTKTKITSDAEGTDTITGIETVHARNLGTTIDGVVVNAGALSLAADKYFGEIVASKIAGGGSANLALGSEIVFWDTSENKSAVLTDFTGWTVKGVNLSNAADDITLANNDTFTLANGTGTLKLLNKDLTKGDTFSFSATESQVTNAGSSDTALVTLTHATHGDVTVVLDLSLGGFNETTTITDDAGAALSGGKGVDKFTGAKGNDTLDGGDGADTLDGAEGDDQLLGGDGDDSIVGGDGNDYGNGGDGDDSFNGGKGDDAFFAGADDNGNDTYKGGEGNDTLGGGEGNDNLDGGAGENLLFGGEDNDTIVVASGDDSLEGNGAAWAGEGNDTVTGGAKDDVIGGGDGDDSIVAGDGNDTVYGGKTGDEVVAGGKGDDLVFGGTDRDTLNGNDGNDTIFGGDDKDDIDGDAGNDVLWGGAGNDSIIGDAGNDTIDGGTGNDNLDGDAGADTFVFEAGDGADTISDFENSESDVLDLSAFTGLSGDILDYATETTQGGSSGVLVNLGNNDSIFMTGVDLGEVREASITWNADVTG